MDTEERDPCPPGAVKHVQAVRISTAGPPERIDEDLDVAAEAAITVEVAEVGAYTLMCSPFDTRAIAVGFMFTEGIITSADDIAIINQCLDDPNKLAVRLIDPSKAGGMSRNLVITTSCGMCGSKTLDEMLGQLPSVGDTLRIEPTAIRLASLALRERQHAFTRTGGTHAAGIFTPDGQIFAFAEDIGRHNALDKAIGKAVLAGRDMSGSGVALSGRVSLELVTKCARAGIELIAAVSAPTSLAIEAVNRCGITLCGFVRGERATIYTRPERIGQGRPTTKEMNV